MFKMLDFLINKNHKIFISYADAKKFEADQIYYFFKNNNVELIKDDISVKYSESYEGFMEKIANSNYIIMILSREFFRSRHCMYEVILSLTKEGYDKKIIPIVTIKEDIDSAAVRERLLAYWNYELDKLRRGYNRDKKGSEKKIYEEIHLYKKIIDNLDDILKKLGMIKGYNLYENNMDLETICNNIYYKIFKKEPRIKELQKIEEFIKNDEYQIFNISNDILRVQMAFFIKDLKKSSSFKISLYSEDPYSEKEYSYIRHKIIAESCFGPSLYLTMYDINNREVDLQINDIQSVNVNNSFFSDAYLKYYITIVDREKRKGYEEQMSLPENIRDNKIISEGYEVKYRVILKYIEKNAFEY